MPTVGLSVPMPAAAAAAMMTNQTTTMPSSSMGRSIARPGRSRTWLLPALSTAAVLLYCGQVVSGAGRIPVMYFWVVTGSAIGGALRCFLSGLVASHFGETFPWGTLFVNVTGSFVIGFFATLTAPDGRLFASAAARQFVMTGICGGYTTFSSFSLQTLNLARDDQWLYASANVVASSGLCLLFVWLGHIAAAGINQMKGT